MFRVIHPNRWFFYVIAFLAATALVLEIFILKTVSDLERTSDELAHSEVFWKTFRSQDLGFSLRYPPGWQIELDRLEPRSVTLENPQNFGENISISMTTPKYEAIIRSSLKVFSEEKATVGGLPAAWLKGDPRDRATNNVILIHKDAELYYIAGSSPVFDKIIESFKFLPAK
ncbi:MAG: hypothetical protein HY398_02165 [Candidatus Doudnabacteria bacterium]|nr:hypothetical protein [Candidatus Doudnabacteria bacterium]